MAAKAVVVVLLLLVAVAAGAVGAARGRGATEETRAVRRRTECPGQEVGTDAVALSLAGCTSFTGTLTLTGLLSRDGLAALTFETAETLAITGLSKLESLLGLKVTSATGTVSITANPVLFSLEGLEALHNVSGSLIIRDNAKLVDSISLTKSLVSIGGDLEVVDNPLLCNIKVGTAALEVGGASTLDISCLPLTVSMSVLGALVACTLAACAVVELRKRRVVTYKPIN